MWVYADGRLITVRELAGQGAVQEQRLGPLGVEILRTELLRTAEPARPDSHGTTVRNRGGVIWGSASVRIGDVAVPVRWSDAKMPARLVDPGPWLPALAWADRNVIGYVAARYAVCLWPDASRPTLGLLPRAVTDLLLEEGTPLDPGSATPVPECLAVTTEVARDIDAALVAAGVARELSHAARFHLVGADHDILRILPMTPDGQVICDCG